MKSARQTACTDTDETDDINPIGVLLINLGTPDSCTPRDVRRYLKEFLSDPRVVEMPRAIWWLILRLAILTTRPRKSARAYQKIWGADGSPLLAISRRQQHKLQEHWNAHNGPAARKVAVALGMRYGNPSIASALAELDAAGVRRLLALPLYPQYCAATTASAFDALCAALSRRRRIPALRMIDQYHDHRNYIAALAGSVRDYRRAHGGAMLLMSFHGIPQSYADAGDPYRDQCHRTARLLAGQLGLAEGAWRVSFQSRFGHRPWLRPYTDETLVELARGGARDVQVICPGFSADCLETLDEIAIENRAVFLRAGGANFGCIPCLNDNDAHIAALRGLIDEHIHDWLAPAGTHAQ